MERSPIYHPTIIVANLRIIGVRSDWCNQLGAALAALQAALDMMENNSSPIAGNVRKLAYEAGMDVPTRRDPAGHR